jgi:hypothetical protein
MKNMEKDVDKAITMVEKKSKVKLDGTNPHVRETLRALILSKRAEKYEEKRKKIELLEEQMTPFMTDRILPGCRELFGDFLNLPIPSTTPDISYRPWKSIDETIGKSSAR